MARLNAEEIIAITGGTDRGDDNGGSFTSFSIDTRTLESGDLFIALVGPNFDGHEFVPEAVRKGAAAVLIARPTNSSPPSIVSAIRLA